MKDWLNILAFLRNRLGFARTYMERSVRTGEKVVRLPLGPLSSYLVNDLPLATQVLTQTGKTFRKDRFARSLVQLLGNGLLVAEPDTWKEHRRQVQPAFHQVRLNEYVPIFNRRTHEWLAAWQPGHTRQISADFTDLTIRVVGECLLGARLGARITIVERAVTQWLKHFSNPFAMLKPLAPLWPSPFYARLRRTTQEFEALIQELLDEALKNPDTTSFVASLVKQAGNKNLDRKLIRDEIVTMLIAGHETTANGLSWTAWLLASHPVWQTRAAEEARALGRDPENLEDLQRLPVLEAIIQESLRLYPPIWGLGRQATETSQLGEFALQPGDHVTVCMATLMRDPRYFEFPDEFRPERWLTGIDGRMANPAAFLAFSAGPRSCIGRDFSIYEAQTIFAITLRRFQLSPTAKKPKGVQLSFTLRPKGGVHLKIDARL